MSSVITAFPHPSASLRILILGAGGREHALAWKIAQSSRVASVVVSPGNGGTGAMGGKITNMGMDQVAWGGKDGFGSIVRWAVENKIDLVVPGPEQPLVDGAEAVFKIAGIPCFGPSPAAALLEGSKALSKAFMARHSIPTAKFETFTSSQYEQALTYLRSAPYPRFVLKASGLAAGKGVLLPETLEEAENALKSVLVDKEFGDAGSEIVIEEYLEGPELSILAFCDGYTIKPLPAAQDHKRIGEGDTGANTGGMGAYAPAPVGTEEIMKRCMDECLEPTMRGMRKDGHAFVGLLFTGFILTTDGPKVLEYNVRFGDPETEALMLLLSDKVDLAEVMLACVERRLDSVELSYKKGYAISVILASKGYPGSYPKGVEITVGQMPEGVHVFHAGTKASNGKIITDGGRVLAVCAAGNTLREAVDLAYKGVDAIHFDGKTYRRDIAYRALGTASNAPKAGGLTYAAAGVSVDNGNSLVEAIKPVVKATRRPGADGVIGGFGGTFDLKAIGMVDPVLVSGTDGVGTKLRVALDCNKHDTVGIDLVAMSVNDLIVQGAEPLYFLDYFACSKLEVPVAADVVTGIAEGCLRAGCALIGGETAEMPGMYHGGDYDLAGFAVGAVERKHLLPTPDIAAGDILLGLPSSGPHSNGFSLLRKVVELAGLQYSSPAPWAANTTIGDQLLVPTQIYIKQLLPAIRGSLLKGMSHITGGGFTENIPRVLPENIGCRIDAATWELPALWKWIMKTGDIAPSEMARTFNMGVGMVIVVSKSKVEEAMKSIRENGEEGVFVMGEVTGKSGVEIVGMDRWSQ